ncbi:Methyltransferase domain-containing protein [Litoreibacter ascidiaceicola]|uniref:Methyltransferase domain-containing protein n=1 Tax=Litoreibacter ascidiaceicola TaxID=1486859 RepID=A0A1M5DUM1_9RHOB|nr:Methyltransferase domain-containing protein [Litoreibacter ascidiaceicola]
MGNFWHRVRRRLGLKPKSKALDLYRSNRRQFDAFQPLLAFHEKHFAEHREAEAALSRKGGEVSIYHSGSNSPAQVKVATSAKFLDMFNFRESFVDPTGLNARQRQLLLAVQSRISARGETAALFEYNTPLHNEFRNSGLKVTASHYVDREDDPHREDMQKLSYADAAFDFAIHCDVLEHVPDQKAALAECYRILKPGGKLVFTAPVFPMEHSVLRAELGDDGTLIRHHPDEIHGDNLTDGVLTFHNFGWDLVETLRIIGFEPAKLEVCVSDDLGLYSTNCPLWTSLDPLEPGNMLPLVVVGEKCSAKH